MTPALVDLALAVTGMVLGGALGYLIGKNSRRRDEDPGGVRRVTPAPALVVPAAHEPPHARWCTFEDGAWHCEQRCAWAAWKTELAMREVPPPPGSRTLKVIK